MAESGYYPMGASYDKDAPFNEEEQVKYRRFVSITISSTIEVECPKDSTDEEIERIIQEDILRGNLPSKYDIDEIAVIL